MPPARRVPAWYDKGEYDKAIKDYDEAIRLDPSDPQAFSNRGIVRSARGEYGKAIRTTNSPTTTS
jgi:tetratricopeptide (TPR) repeat protein